MNDTLLSPNDYRTALARVEALMDAAPGSQEEQALEGDASS